MYPQSQDWRQNREGTVHLPASGGDGARVDSMVNTSESSINAVSENKPKIADRLKPKWHRSEDLGLSFPQAWTNHTTGGQRAPHPSLLIMRNVVSPYRSFHKEGRAVVRPTDGGAGMGVGRSEGPPVVGGIRVATLPGPKGS